MHCVYISTHSLTSPAYSCSSHLFASHLISAGCSHCMRARIIHQVGNLVYASPAISSVGVVFVDSNQLGCKPFWQRWLHGRHEHHTKILQVHFVLVIYRYCFKMKHTKAIDFVFLLFVVSGAAALVVPLLFYIILCECVRVRPSAFFFYQTGTFNTI